MCCGVCAMPAEWIERQIEPRRRNAKGLTGRHVLIGFVAFFLIVAGSNAVMLTAAIRTMPGLDARNGYDPSQAYNGEIAAAATQDSSGYEADLRLVRSGGGLDIGFTLAGADGRPEGRSATIRLEHPSDRKHDAVLELETGFPGVFAGHVDDLEQGARNLVIEVRALDGKRIFLDRQRVTIGAAS
jgi:nitrogen fixation protein FixH